MKTFLTVLLLSITAQAATMKAEWSVRLRQAIAAQKFPQDVPKPCPKASVDECIFIMASDMIFFESGYDPDMVYAESGKLAGVKSRGLFQISIGSSNGYSCGFKKEKELHDPLKNIDCAMKILNKWITQDRVFYGEKKCIKDHKVTTCYFGGARYWSVLRSMKKGKPRDSYLVITKVLKGS